MNNINLSFTSEQIEALYRTIEKTPVANIPSNHANALLESYSKLRQAYFDNLPKSRTENQS